MRLTNYIRDAFVTAALQDVPQVDFSEQVSKIVVDDAVGQLPLAVQKLWKDSATRPYVKTTSAYYLGSSTMVPTHSAHCNPALSQETLAKLNEITRAKQAQTELMDALKTKLRAAAYGCTTRKALAELLPEFDKYLPEEETKGSNLPAVANLLSDFVKAGWPKDAKKMPKAEQKDAVLA